MNIDKATALKPGDKVRCPADRGYVPFTGTVVQGSGEVYKSHNGTPYVWITVQGLGSKSVWPSNRLS